MAELIRVGEKKHPKLEHKIPEYLLKLNQEDISDFLSENSIFSNLLQVTLGPFNSGGFSVGFTNNPREKESSSFELTQIGGLDTFLYNIEKFLVDSKEAKETLSNRSFKLPMYGSAESSLIGYLRINFQNS